MGRSHYGSSPREHVPWLPILFYYRSRKVHSTWRCKLKSQSSRSSARIITTCLTVVHVWTVETSRSKVSYMTFCIVQRVAQLTRSVLPPISTIGLTSSDVDALVESTRSAMVTALESISRPGPAHRHDIHVAPEDLQTPKAELPRQLGHPIQTDQEEKTRRRNQQQESSSDDTPAITTTTSVTTGNELRTVDSRGGESTEDEMDDDAVLLKHPKRE